MLAPRAVPSLFIRQQSENHTAPKQEPILYLFFVMYHGNASEGSDPAQLPIYQKGREIFELVVSITDLVPDHDEALSHVKGLMLEDAAALSVNVAGAEGGDLYDIRMECATMIRKAARDLSSHCYTLEIFGFADAQYFSLVKDALEAYRLLFLEWVKGFDAWNYVLDDWGLFNPPGIAPGNGQ